MPVQRDQKPPVSPKAVEKINDFSGGQNSTINSTLLNKNEAQIAENVSLEQKGTIRPRKGRKKRYPIPFINAPVSGLTGYYKKDGTSRLLIASGDKLYADKPSDSIKYTEKADFEKPGTSKSRFVNTKIFPGSLVLHRSVFGTVGDCASLIGIYNSDTKLAVQEKVKAYNKSSLAVALAEGKATGQVRFPIPSYIDKTLPYAFGVEVATGELADGMKVSLLTSTGTAIKSNTGYTLHAGGVGPNRALNVIPTSNGAIANPAFCTDGGTVDDSYTQVPALVDGADVYLKLDLGAVYDIGKIHVWHFYADGRTCKNLKLEVSEDDSTWTTVYASALSGTYVETANGRVHLFPTQKVRYIREWMNGSDKDTNNRWCEIKAYEFVESTFRQLTLKATSLEMQTAGYLSVELSGQSGQVGFIDGAIGIDITQAEYDSEGYVVPRYNEVEAANRTFKYDAQNLSQGVFTNTELVDGKLQLKRTGVPVDASAPLETGTFTNVAVRNDGYAALKTNVTWADLGAGRTWDSL